MDLSDWVTPRALNKSNIWVSAYLKNVQIITINEIFREPITCKILNEMNKVVGTKYLVVHILIITNVGPCVF